MGQNQPRGYTDDPVQIVAALRSSLHTGDKDAVTAALGRFDALDAALSRILAEHSGMAEELLRVYEQLGIVFDVTRTLPTVREEHEVVRLFLENLRPTHPGALVTAVEFDDDGRPTIPGGEGEFAPWVREALAKCRDERRVVVAQRPTCERLTETLPCQSCDGEQGASSFFRVMCGPIYAGDTFVCALLLGQHPEQRADGGPAVAGAFDASDMLLLDSLDMFCGDLIRNFRLLGEVRQLSIDMVRVLVSAIEQKDEYTSGHSTRVGHFAKLLGTELGLDQATLQMLEWSALLHDIGKIGIRDQVLKKPGKLTEEEFEHIKEHPVRSCKVVREVPQLAEALHGVAYHHEHWDGSGYPEGLAGEQIPLPARIIQVADVFDALTSTRSYRKAFQWTKALEILQQEAGTTVDPNLCATFCRLIRRIASQQPELLEQIMSVRRGRCRTSPPEWSPATQGEHEMGGA